MEKSIILFVPLLLMACTPNESRFKSDVPVSRPSIEERLAEGGTDQETETVSESVAPLPDSINLDVPFFPQAPDADWSLPWQEACEEASLTLAYHYFSEEPLTKEQFKNDIFGLIEWQKEHFGDYLHTTVAQTAEMLEGYFGFTDYRIIENPTVEDLKTELAAGHIIVAPFAGRLLGNPFYSGEGPYYHMMVIKGYDGKNFITSDVGTRRGLNFIYPYQTFLNALHDYHETAIQSAPKKVIVLE
ncbi:MAG: C39 family peptidase [Patescibacteria group bacterium]